MQTVEQLKEHYGSNITSAQLDTLEENKDRMGGYRSVWYDSICDCVMVCFENTGMICGIEKDGELHS